ncbi:hypothetical protein ACWC09_21195 [Streptomyces sp. NPDC001617]
MSRTEVDVEPGSGPPSEDDHAFFGRPEGLHPLRPGGLGTLLVPRHAGAVAAGLAVMAAMPRLRRTMHPVH